MSRGQSPPVTETPSLGCGPAGVVLAADVARCWRVWLRAVRGVEAVGVGDAEVGIEHAGRVGQARTAHALISSAASGSLARPSPHRPTAGLPARRRGLDDDHVGVLARVQAIADADLSHLGQRRRSRLSWAPWPKLGILAVPQQQPRHTVTMKPAQPPGAAARVRRLTTAARYGQHAATPRR
jgi:hypothetical protein